MAPREGAHELDELQTAAHLLLDLIHAAKDRGSLLVFFQSENNNTGTGSWLPNMSVKLRNTVLVMSL